jgi:hypothetical protein
MALARSLGISLGILAVLDVEMDERELIARADIVGALLGTSHGLPARAEMRGDQSCILPLRFVTTDGFGGIYRSLHLHPLRQTEIRAVPKAHDRRFAIMLRYAVRQSAFETGATSYLPMQSARGLADAMDAVDYFAANAAILHITALAVRKKGSR